ncbi:MAG TPA: NADP-dependent oxidoreductase [Gaiellaceae bacterium]
MTLASRPVGFPQESDFVVDEAELPSPGRGEVLVRTTWVSVDPYQRGRMSTARSYAKGLELGDVITAQAVGEVVESNDSRYEPGDTVLGQLGWQDYALARGGSLRKLPSGIEPQLALHVLGATGLTAYFGLLDVAQPVPGDTVVVSGAGGAVGSIVGQIARIMGCRTVGIAGGADKVEDLRELYRFDEAIDYKATDLRAALKEACPDGVDVYFDNCGGEISAAVHARLNVGARIAICGQVSQYNLERPEPTFHPALLIVYRARMQGFLVTDYVHRFGEAIPKLARWVMNSDIRYREHVTEGLENAPRAFIGMLNGENRGKALVKL